MKKIKIILHLLSFIFFTTLLFILFLKDGKLFDRDFFVFIAAYILFAGAPLLSLALQYEIHKDKNFFSELINSNTESLKMSDYLRISFLLFYHLGTYIGVRLRKILLKKEYRKTDIVHLNLIGEVIKRKKILLAILIVQLIMIIALFGSYFFIK